MKYTLQTIFILVLILVTVQVLDGREPVILGSVNLIFHEAGHPLFGLFGQVIGMAGGTMMQLLVPLVCVAAFTRQKDWFSVAAVSWWFGENMIGISTYVSDARALQLPLLGGDGVIHDWNFLLAYYGILHLDTTIGAWVWWAGCLMMIGAIVGMGWILVKNVKWRMGDYKI